MRWSLWSVHKASPKSVHEAKFKTSQRSKVCDQLSAPGQLQAGPSLPCCDQNQTRNYPPPPPPQAHLWGMGFLWVMGVEEMNHLWCIYIFSIFPWLIFSPIVYPIHQVLNVPLDLQESRMAATLNYSSLWTITVGGEDIWVFCTNSISCGYEQRMMEDQMDLPGRWNLELKGHRVDFLNYWGKAHKLTI